MRGGWVAAMARCFPPVAALRAVIVASVMVAAFAFPGVAGAWQLSKSTNGVVLTREASDTTTTTVEIRRYYNYKQGDVAWSFVDSSLHRPNDYTAWNNYDGVCTVQPATKNDTIEIPLKAGWRLQMISVQQLPAPNTVYETFAVINDPLAVSVNNTPTVNIGTQPPISLSSSVSVAGTMPVTVDSVASVDRRALDVVFASLVLFVGIASYRMVFHG